MSGRRIALIVAAAFVGLVVVAWIAAYALLGVGGVSSQSASGGSSGGAVSDGAVTREMAYSGQAAPMAAPESKAVAPSETDASAQTAGAAGTPRQIIRTATITMTVKKVPPAIVQLRALVAAAGGEISSLNYSAGVDQPIPMPLAESDGSASTVGPQSATVVIRVPVTKLDSLATKVARLGDVTAQSADQEDITAQVVDLEARLKNLQAEEARLRSFFAKANRVADMLSIEQELARVRGEIEAMQAQRRYLADQVAMSTLTVNMSQPAPVVSPAGTDWGFGDALTRGIQAAAALLRGAIVIVIALLPAIAAILLVWWLVALWLRRRRRTHPTQKMPATTLEPDDTQAAAEDPSGVDSE